MYVLCHIFIPIEISLKERVTSDVTKDIATKVANQLTSGHYQFLNVYEYLGEIENYNEKYDNLTGTTIIVSLEYELTPEIKKNPHYLISEVIRELQKNDLHIASHTDNHIAFIKDYD